MALVPRPRVYNLHLSIEAKFQLSWPILLLPGVPLCLFLPPTYHSIQTSMTEAARYFRLVAHVYTLCLLCHPLTTVTITSSSFCSPPPTFSWSSLLLSGSRC
ncbi:hypothetical protein V8F33_009130 [Rhypophila sp. PSN 637]